MSGLFIELYLDEDVSILVAELLRGRGYSAITTHGEDRLGRTDADQLAYATAQGWALLTHNRADFAALADVYASEGRDHAGIILARRYPPYELVRRLMRLLDQVTAGEMRNQVRYV